MHTTLGATRSASRGRAARLALACGVSAAALTGAVPAFAEDAAKSGAELVVTGSRIRQVGMTTPVPVTAVSVTELKAMSPGVLVEGLAQLPQFYNNQTPNSGAAWFTRAGYGNLDIRGLGVNRTLTLLNGRRVISQTAFGGVDTNMFPQDMIRSVETVTGGASAAYGTDAVAGVTNFLLDTKFTGMRVSGQYGETTRGDSMNWQGSASAGFQLGDKLHVLLSGDYHHQDGVHSYKGRDWYQGWGTVPDANGMLLIRPNVVSRGSSFDGIIVAPGSALNGLMFTSSGTTTPFVTSSLSTGTVGSAGARQSIAGGGSGDDLGAEVWTLYPDLTRYSAFAYADYQLSPNLNVFVQYLHGFEETFRYNTPRGSFQGSPTTLTIFRDNAFLPNNVQQIMVAENRASFTFRRTGSSLDIGRRISLRDTSELNSFTAGFHWDSDSAGMFKGWTVDGYYQYGRNTRRGYQIGLRVDRIFAAVDAVRNPANGQVVCRTTLSASPLAGCQPLNLFGRGQASPAAIDWVVGNDVGEHITTPLFFADTGFTLGETDDYIAQEAKVNITSMRQHVAELSAQGDIYKGFGAGPVKLALGGSFRQENIHQIVRDSTNKSSDHSKGHPVLCNTDAAAIAAGLRGISQPDCTNTVGIQFSKVSNIQGTIEVKELFAETAVPLIADQPFMKLLKVDLAGRWADYSGSGTIWAYKGGVDAQVLDWIRLRGTYSRDVRAANLSERFDKTGGVATVTDPRFPADGNVTVTIFSGGNPNVRPEKADTFTAGAVFQPKWGVLNGLSISADWYRIKINDAIGQLGAQAVVNQCEAGATEICTLITRDANTGKLVLVGNLFVNITEALVRGVDLESVYRKRIHVFGGGDEVINARLFASWLLENKQAIGSTTPIDRAGQTGIQQSDGIPYSLPKFKATGSVTYANGPFSMFVQGRYIGSGTFENSAVVGKTIESNHVDSVFYTDVRLGYAFKLRDNSTWEVFGTVNNLFDVDPPVTPYWSAFASYTNQYNASLFDVLGRRFVVGAKYIF